MSYQESARQFEEEEKQFQLGFLPTEQSSPLTKQLDKEFARSTADGIRNLQLVDQNVLKMCKVVFASEQFKSLVASIVATVRNGKRVVFSGCGATGRLSILLESMWRTSCPEYADHVKSIMTGGDYALVKSVECFEDYAAFGARQVRDMGLTADDLLVAITEGGETSSVLGTIKQFTALGGKAYLLFNNPAHLLREHLERCREAIDNPSVTVLDLACGPMALAGSTRMQATTSEQLVASCALEAAIQTMTGNQHIDFYEGFKALLDILAQENVVNHIAQQIELEERIYAKHGLVTYFADDYMLDLFTDTTERSPTFMIPGFHRTDDVTAPESWAFVRNPLLDTPSAIQRALGNRVPRCLAWTREDYIAMKAEEKLLNNLPRISRRDFEMIPVGNEPMPARYATGNDLAVLLLNGEGTQALRDAFAENAKAFSESVVYNTAPATALPATRMKVFEHLAVKLQWNIISTGTMVRLGRVTGNWMSFVAISNKKLIDRAIRLICEIGNVDYHTACLRLYKVMEEGDPDIPAVQQALKG